jgi:hypothetical protein
MQLEALAGWEALLQQLAAVPDPTATDEERAKKLVTAAMLDMQALKLQQELRPATADAAASATVTTATPAAATSPACATSHPSSATLKAPEAATSPDASSSSSSIGGRAGSSSAAASSSSSSMGCGSAPCVSVRLPHLMAMLDAKEIPALKQLTLAEMAGALHGPLLAYLHGSAEPLHVTPPTGWPGCLLTAAVDRSGDGIKGSRHQAVFSQSQESSAAPCPCYLLVTRGFVRLVWICCCGCAGECAVPCQCSCTMQSACIASNSRQN